MKIRRIALLDAIAVTEERLTMRHVDGYVAQKAAYDKALATWKREKSAVLSTALRELAAEAKRKVPLTEDDITARLKLYEGSTPVWTGYKTPVDIRRGRSVQCYAGSITTQVPVEPSPYELPLDLRNLRVLLEASDDEYVETSQLERQGYRNMAAILAEGKRI